MALVLRSGFPISATHAFAAGTVNSPSATYTAGDLVIVMWAADLDFVKTPALTTTTTMQFRLAHAVGDAVVNNGSSAFIYWAVGDGSTGTITLGNTSASSASQIIVTAYSGADTVNPIGNTGLLVSNGANNIPSGTTVSVNITPSRSDSVILSVGADWNSNHAAVGDANSTALATAFQDATAGATTWSFTNANALVAGQVYTLGTTYSAAAQRDVWAVVEIKAAQPVPPATTLPIQVVLWPGESTGTPTGTSVRLRDPTQIPSPGSIGVEDPGPWVPPPVLSFAAAAMAAMAMCVAVEEIPGTAPPAQVDEEQGVVSAPPPSVPPPYVQTAFDESFFPRSVDEPEGAWPAKPPVVLAWHGATVSFDELPVTASATIVDEEVGQATVPRPWIPPPQQAVAFDEYSSTPIILDFGFPINAQMDENTGSPIDISITFSTPGPNRLLLLAFSWHTETGYAPSPVFGGTAGLTWVQWSGRPDSSSTLPGATGAEIWAALAPSALSAKTVTVNLGGGTGAMGAALWSYTGHKDTVVLANNLGASATLVDTGSGVPSQVTLLGTQPTSWDFFAGVSNPAGLLWTAASNNVWRENQVDGGNTSTGANTGVSQNYAPLGGFGGIGGSILMGSTKSTLTTHSSNAAAELLAFGTPNGLEEASPAQSWAPPAFAPPTTASAFDELPVTAASTVVDEELAGLQWPPRVLPQPAPQPAFDESWFASAVDESEGVQQQAPPPFSAPASASAFDEIPVTPGTFGLDEELAGIQWPPRVLPQPAPTPAFDESWFVSAVEEAEGVQLQAPPTFSPPAVASAFDEFGITPGLFGLDELPPYLPGPPAPKYLTLPVGPFEESWFASAVDEEQGATQAPPLSRLGDAFGGVDELAVTVAVGIEEVPGAASYVPAPLSPPAVASAFDEIPGPVLFGIEDVPTSNPYVPARFVPPVVASAFDESRFLYGVDDVPAYWPPPLPPKGYPPPYAGPPEELLGTTVIIPVCGHDELGVKFSGSAQGHPANSGSEEQHPAFDGTQETGQRFKGTSTLGSTARGVTSQKVC